MFKLQVKALISIIIVWSQSTVTYCQLHFVYNFASANPGIWESELYDTPLRCEIIITIGSLTTIIYSNYFLPDLSIDFTLMLQNVFTLELGWKSSSKPSTPDSYVCLFSCQVSDITSHHKKITFHLMARAWFHGYLPSLFIPWLRHFIYLQYWHLFLCLLSMTQFLSSLHV